MTIELFIVVSEGFNYIFENKDEFNKFNVNNNDYRYSIKYFSKFMNKSDVLRIGKNNNYKYYAMFDEANYLELVDGNWIKKKGEHYLDNEYQIFRNAGIDLVKDNILHEKVLVR